MNRKLLQALCVAMIFVYALTACAPVIAPAPAPTQAPQPTAVPVEPTAALAEPTTVPATTEPTAVPALSYEEPCTPTNAVKPIPDGKLRLVIGTGGTGGVFFPYGGGLARILTEKLTNTEATAEVTGGSVDNMKLVQVGDADLGLSTVDSAYNATQGIGAYKDTGAVPACTLAVLYTSFFHVIALEESGITSVADMKGKRISVGSAGSSTEGLADRVLAAAGLDPKADVTRDNLSVAESVAAMKDRKIDAFFWIGGLPTAAVTDLFSTAGLKANFVDATSLLEDLRSKYGPVYVPFTIPAGTYPGFDQDITGIGIGNILFANADMSEDLAYNILKTLFDNADEVRAVHPEAEKFGLDTAVDGSSIPFHPGAIKFFEEQGAWQGN